MSMTMKAVIHLGPEYTENLEVFKNTNFDEIQSLFSIIQKLIAKHSAEILNVKQIEGTAPSWTRSTLSHDQVIKRTTAKVRVYPEAEDDSASEHESQTEVLTPAHPIGSQVLRYGFESMDLVKLLGIWKIRGQSDEECAEVHARSVQGCDAARVGCHNNW